MFFVLIERCRADDLNFTSCKRRFQDIRRVHGALRASRSDKNVEFIDKQDDVAFLFDFINDIFETLFKISSVFASGDHRSDVKSNDSFVFQRFGNAPVNNVLCQALGDRGLADARLAYKTGVVLRSARKNLNYSFDLGASADDRIDLVLTNHFGQIRSVRVQRRSVFIPRFLRG